MVLALALPGCVSNTDPGNDREAQLDPPEQPAETAPAAEAVAGVEVSLLHPELITDADFTLIPDASDRCVFRFTRVDFPVFVYSRANPATGIMKLNGKLVSLPGSANGRFASGGVEVILRAVEEEAEPGEQHLSELILMLPDAPDELGYRGFSECNATANLDA